MPSVALSSLNVLIIVPEPLIKLNVPVLEPDVKSNAFVAPFTVLGPFTFQ